MNKVLSYSPAVRRRILLLNTDLEIGGTPTVVRELARRLRRPAVTVEVAALSKWGPIGDQLKESGVEVTALDAKGVSDLWIIRRLVDLIRERRIDTVFSFLVHANGIAAAAKPSCEGVRFFQSIQTTQAHPAWHWHIQRFVHHAAEKVIVPSASVARVAIERAKVPVEKVIVIPNAIDPGDFGVGMPAEGRPFPIGFLGRLDPVKMVPDLVAAVGLLGDLVHLNVYGEGADRGAVERAIRTHGVSGKVTMQGRIAQPQAALGEIGLLVLPSVSEGMPMVLIEAMTAGVAVLGRDVPGVRDVIEDGRTGVLVRSLSVKDLAEGIRRLVEDGEMRRRLIANAREEVSKKYTWDAVLPRYREVLGIKERGR